RPRGRQNRRRQRGHGGARGRGGERSGRFRLAANGGAWSDGALAEGRSAREAPQDLRSGLGRPTARREGGARRRPRAKPKGGAGGSRGGTGRARCRGEASNSGTYF